MKTNNITIGILAHVDAGKTTLSESILYTTGAIRSRGRVDHGDAFLDTDAMERQRGITIFSKMARFEMPEGVSRNTSERGAAIHGVGERACARGQVEATVSWNPRTTREGERACARGQAESATTPESTRNTRTQRSVAHTRNWTLLDTPGHADFSPEMERTLRVLDAAILVISAPDGVTAQVRTLWRLLRHYEVPTFVFVNKMDLATERTIDDVAAELRQELGEGFVPLDLAARDLAAYEEEIAVLDEELMEHVLGGGHVTEEDIVRLVRERRLCPVLGGSALRDEGTTELLAALAQYLEPREYPDAFAARVYKVTREDGQRLTWMKITGGELHVRDAIVNGEGLGADAALSDDGSEEDAAGGTASTGGTAEKVAEIRYYNGSRFDRETTAQAGDIVAVTGLSYTKAGDGLGAEETNRKGVLSPILTSRVTALPGADGSRPDDHTLLKALRDLEEEEPLLHVMQDERTHDILVQIMGQVQIEILQRLLQDRHGIVAEFGQSRIVYKETIRRPVEGVGHFEPLRHYAEVHVLLEPQAPGTGIVFGNETPPNVLDKNWQNLILTHLQERTFRGVLTGSALTDVKITLLGGKASIKHTVGGDFRQAAYRAVRQGLMSAENILLEPVLSYRVELPQEYLGRAMTDINAMGGSTNAPEFDGAMAAMTGRVPAQAFGDYAQQVTGYTKGAGSIRTTLAGYAPCHNAREIIDEAAYDPELDRWNPSYSVFCSHGAGTPITWDHVRARMHYDSEWTPAQPDENGVCHDGPLEDGRYLTNDYYTFAETPDEEIAADLNQLDGMTAEERVRAAQEREAHMARVAAPEADYETRNAAVVAEDKALQAIFESTYGTAYHRRDRSLRHPENERFYDANGNEIDTDDESADHKPRGPVGGDPKYADRKARKMGMRTSDHGGSIQGTGERACARGQASASRDSNPRTTRDEYLLVDGYNIIYAWSDLRALADTNIDAARDRLSDILANYAGYVRENVILVYDAYKVHGGKGELYRYHGIDIVYTKEAETADLYIERTAHQLAGKARRRVTVATSDAIEQVIIFSAGAVRLSARGLLERILAAEEDMRQRYL